MRAQLNEYVVTVTYRTDDDEDAERFANAVWMLAQTFRLDHEVDVVGSSTRRWSGWSWEPAAQVKRRIRRALERVA